jgi:hypothetical protein
MADALGVQRTRADAGVGRCTVWAWVLVQTGQPVDSWGALKSLWPVDIEIVFHAPSRAHTQI